MRKETAQKTTICPGSDSPHREFHVANDMSDLVRKFTQRIAGDNKGWGSPHG